MGNTDETAKSPLVPKPTGGGPDRQAPVTHSKRSEKKPFDGSFPDWPNITDNVIPDEFIKIVDDNRAAIAVVPDVNYKAGVNRGFVNTEKGYSFAGTRNDAPTNLIDEKSMGQVRLKIKGMGDETAQAEMEAKFLAVVNRMGTEELKGEGFSDSIMTGDGAVITWGHGLGYAGGGYMAAAFGEFLSTPDAGSPSGTSSPTGAIGKVKRRFLDHGIAMMDGQLYVMDTRNRKIFAHTDAANYLNGHDDPDYKKRMLSIFVRLTQEFPLEAANAQWNVVLRNSILASKEDILTAIKNKWDTELITYVIHCQMWGRFATWPAFLKLGPDAKKVLRLEVDHTNFYKHSQTESGKNYFLVPPKDGSRTPSGTMVENMGPGYIQKFLIPWKTEAEFQSGVESGDVVFQLNNTNGKPGYHYFALKGTSQIEDANAELTVWVEEHQGMSMASLLKAAAERSKQNKLTKTRDWYIAAANPRQMEWGIRPLIAMNAELAKSDFQKALEVMGHCKENGFSPTSLSDQYNAIVKHVNLGQYDDWVETHQAYSMDKLIQAIQLRSHKDNQHTRDWYASDRNPKKEKFGLRPRIALDAVLHKGEGQNSAWILNDCERAGINMQDTPTQLEIIKKTVGIA